MIYKLGQLGVVVFFDSKNCWAVFKATNWSPFWACNVTLFRLK